MDWKDERREGGGEKNENTLRKSSFPIRKAGCPFLPARAASGSLVPDVTAVARGRRVFISAALLGVNAGVVWVGLTLHNLGYCAREARRSREQGRNYAVPQGPAFLSSCVLLRRQLREVLQEPSDHREL